MKQDHMDNLANMEIQDHNGQQMDEHDEIEDT